MSELVGREQELASLDTFIGNVGGETSVLVLAGEAGIGKSTLWLAGVESARARGLRVLSSRPAENERSLALHERVGFRRIGVQRRLGQDAGGRWRDVVLLERRSEVLGTD